MTDFKLDYPMSLEYQINFTGLCPVDRSSDNYHATLTTSQFISCEELREWTADCGENPFFQEDLTLMMARKFECAVTLVGWHKGIRIVSKAEFRE